MDRGRHVKFAFENVGGNGEDLVITATHNESNGWDIEVMGPDGLTEDDFESVNFDGTELSFVLKNQSEIEFTTSSDNLEVEAKVNSGTELVGDLDAGTVEFADGFAPIDDTPEFETQKTSVLLQSAQAMFAQVNQMLRRPPAAGLILIG